MPARKNRPDKFGGAPKPKAKPELDADVRALALKFIVWERRDPKKDHYVGWLDMDTAKEMERRGLIKEGGVALGCFFITDKFRTDFYEEMR